MPGPVPILIFDFDSTLIRGEGLDELFARSVEGSPDRVVRTRAFSSITDRGMAGEIPFADSLEERISLLATDRATVARVANDLAGQLTPSVARHAAFFQRNRDLIYVVSGGFVELIEPAARELGLDPGRVGANRFRYDHREEVIGVDPDTLLAREGKAGVVRSWGLEPEEVWVVGDGATDLELRELGLARRFVAFTENRRREPVVARADHVAESMEDLISLLNQV
jgi:D-3-phosphoglycerate dehydrogenase / 2-oxoglutarate reductase